ncbi:MAG TPA: aspartate aminotransferase family protein [Burkholderiales bacterium]|nr:aspartate aminotransferase family protein [Burkholderiales bacterium]
MNIRDDRAIREVNRSLNLEPLWLPFTPNRQFKAAPRLLAGAKDMHYFTADGRKVLDGIAGLWCVNAGHCREPIVNAIKKQAETMDYATAFNMSHPGAFRAAESLVRIAPKGLDHVFFVNSGSEAVDTALKIALAYHRARGEPQRHRFVGRERGYHGVGFGGVSVGGMTPNRKAFSAALIPGVDHLPHTHDLEKNAFSKGQPEWGAHLADELERIVALHDASNIAAVIVEPVAGSTGVLVPPKGYLQRLRQICDKHGLLLVFDEVITGFGRTGSPFASHTFGVVPDMITFAKGISNGAVPMGGVLVKKEIYDAFMNGPESIIEFFHGYTYSAHPLATAAAVATLDLYDQEGLFERARELSPYYEQAVHSLRGLPHVIDVRNLGLMCGVELAPIPEQPGMRAFDRFLKCFEKGVLVRQAGDVIALTPPLIAQKKHIDELVGTLADVLKSMP